MASYTPSFDNNEYKYDNESTNTGYTICPISSSFQNVEGNLLDEQINDILHEISSDVFILAYFSQMEAFQRDLFYKKLERCLIRLERIIEKRECLIHSPSVTDSLLYDVLVALKQLTPQLLQKMPSFNSFMCNTK